MLFNPRRGAPQCRFFANCQSPTPGFCVLFFFLNSNYVVFFIPTPAVFLRRLGTPSPPPPSPPPSYSHFWKQIVFGGAGLLSRLTLRSKFVHESPIFQTVNRSIPFLSNSCPNPKTEEAFFFPFVSISELFGLRVRTGFYQTSDPLFFRLSSTKLLPENSPPLVILFKHCKPGESPPPSLPLPLK